MKWQKNINEEIIAENCSTQKGRKTRWGTSFAQVVYSSLFFKQILKYPYYTEVGKLCPPKCLKV